MLPVIIADPIAVKRGRRRGFMVLPPLACTRLRCIGSPRGATSTTTPNSIKDGCKWSQMDSPCLPSMKCIKFGAQGLFFSRRGSAPPPSPYPPLDSHTCRFEGPVPHPRSTPNPRLIHSRDTRGDTADPWHAKLTHLPPSQSQ